MNKVPSHSRRFFSRSQRLLKGGEFKSVFADARRTKDEYFLVLGQNTGRETARLGLAIPRKHVKRAVARNRLKRLVRESFRQHQHALSGIDVVVTLRRDPSGLGNQEIFQRLQTHWQQIKQQCVAS